MKFIDLSAQQKRIRHKIETNILKVLDHGQYIMGPEVGVIEENLGEFVGAKHAISCASGTDALLMALMAYNIGPGDAVFTTPFTFIATAEVISLLGATPIFVDIDPNTFNIDPEQLEKAIKAVKFGSANFPLPKTENALPLTPKGVIAVDLFGLPADYDIINTIADQNGLFVIEDAAQSFGAEYKGKKACSLADIACTSFFPAKPFGCYGDGGMCFTNDDKLAEIMESIRVHGKGSDKYDNIRIGINGRLDTIQAAILLTKFDIFPDEIRLRQIVADRYAKHLSGPPFPVTPNIPSEMISAWAQYSILASDEIQCLLLQTKLKDEGIPTAIYYPTPLHLQTAFKPLGYREGSFPESEDISRRIFSLPMHPYLSEEEQKKIGEVIHSA